MTVQGNLIPIVLASTVIATIITTGFNFYKAKKNLDLKGLQKKELIGEEKLKILQTYFLKQRIHKN